MFWCTFFLKRDEHAVPHLGCRRLHKADRGLTSNLAWFAIPRLTSALAGNNILIWPSSALNLGLPSHCSQGAVLSKSTKEVALSPPPPTKSGMQCLMPSPLAAILQLSIHQGGLLAEFIGLVRSQTEPESLTGRWCSQTWMLDSFGPVAGCVCDPYWWVLSGPFCPPALESRRDKAN